MLEEQQVVAEASPVVHAGDEPTHFLDLCRGLVDSLQHNQTLSTDKEALVPEKASIAATSFTLLIEAHRLQEKQLSAGQADDEAECWQRRERLLQAFQSRLLETAEQLGAALDKHAPPEWPVRRTVAATPQQARQVINYAHKLSYTSFAPLGYSQHKLLRNFKPPAPQHWQLAASQLHQFAAQHQAAQSAAAPPPAGMELPAPAFPAPSPAQPLAIPPMPPGWKPGDSLPADIPPMPPGWAPGDPLPADVPPMPPGWQPGHPVAAAEAPPSGKPSPAKDAGTPQPAGQAAAGPPSAPAAGPEEEGSAEEAPVQPARRSAFDFILNPDLEVAEEEASSSEYSEDD